MISNELRIGNWLNDFAMEPHQVIRLTKDKTILETAIPLTEEWLIKFGFNERADILKNKYYVLGIESDYGSELIASKNKESILCVYLTDCDGGNVGIEKKYVHQLQNLYYCLCGEELTLNT